MSHTQLQTGVLAGATRGLQRIQDLDIRRQELEQRQEQDFLRNIMSIAKEDPENAERIFRESPLRQKFGEVKFGKKVGTRRMVEINIPGTPKQTGLLDFESEEFIPIEGLVLQKREGSELERILGGIFGIQAEEKKEAEPGEPEGRPSLFPDTGKVGIGREEPVPARDQGKRPPLPPGRVRVIFTSGPNKGRRAHVAAERFDTTTMRRVQ